VNIFEATCLHILCAYATVASDCSLFFHRSWFEPNLYHVFMFPFSESGTVFQGVRVLTLLTHVISFLISRQRKLEVPLEGGEGLGPCYQHYTTKLYTAINFNNLVVSRAKIATALLEVCSHFPSYRSLHALLC
jgi:hypothetical protein